MRGVAFLGLASVVVLVAPALADDASQDDKAQAAYNDLIAWIKAQQPTAPADKKALRVEVMKRLSAFLQTYPNSGRVTSNIREVYGNMLVEDKRYDDALAQYELVAKSDEPADAAYGAAKIVRTLMLKKDYVTARKRLDDYVKTYPDDKNLPALDDSLKKVEAGSALKPGAKAPPIEKTKTFAGADFSLSDWKGKVVLVDFWATPKLSQLDADAALREKLLADLEPKGFEVVGVVVFEKDDKDLKQLLAADKITWPQLVADGKSIAVSYGVTKIPGAVLIGKDGKIVALGLRGLEVDKAVRAIMAGKPYTPGDASAPKPSEGNDGGGGQGGDGMDGGR